jgi:hypothetical protein
VAYRKAACHKRCTGFERQLADRLLGLQRELTRFTIHEPKRPRVPQALRQAIHRYTILRPAS